MAVRRDINYLNRDFNALRDQLITYSKTYFPNTYNDFTPASPGMMFMEMAAYVGDVLSFYLDNQFQETFIQYARQTNNLYDLAYMLGYKPKVTSAATAELTFYQTVPSIVSSSVNIPDYSYQYYQNTSTHTIKELTNNRNQTFTFQIKDSFHRLLDLNGKNIVFTLCIHKEDNTNELIKESLLLHNEDTLSSRKESNLNIDLVPNLDDTNFVIGFKS